MCWFSKQATTGLHHNQGFKHSLSDEQAKQFCFISTTVLDMDSNRHGKARHSSYMHAGSQQDRSFLRPLSVAEDYPAHTAHLSAPIPQTQWSYVPDIFRPPSWSFSTSGRNKPLPSPPSTMHQSLEVRSSSATSKSRKERPGYLRGSTGSSIQQDPSLLYPEMNPYHTSGMTRSAPHDVQHFSRQGRPPTLDIITPSLRASSLPRSPIYPPSRSSRSRTRGHSTGNDHALQDEEECRLFIEATAGIGPIPSFRQGSVTEDNWLDIRREPRQPMPPAMVADSPVSAYTGTMDSQTSRYLDREAFVSPTGDTPTTVQALRGLAQMPRARSTSPQRRRAENAADPVVDISDSGLNIWDEDTDEPLQSHPADSWAEIDAPVPDDELPTYASSQAQAHASQIAAATRRAQELQRQWKEGGRRYGPEI